MAGPSVMRINVPADLENDRALREGIEIANQILDGEARSSLLNQQWRKSGISIRASRHFTSSSPS